MKYKIGDKVRVREDLKVGKSYNGWYFYGLMAEQIGKVVTIKDALGNLEGYFYLIEELDDYYVWTSEMFSGLAEESRSLIPLIARELGVEIGEEFIISNRDYVYKITEDGLIGIDDDLYKHYAPGTFYELIIGEEQIIKLPSKPKLTEAEKVILENLPKEYKYIKRFKYGGLYVYDDSTNMDYFNMFQHLFQFIKEDKEPYSIEELLKE